MDNDMFKNQHGVTLLEVILSIGIIGWVMSYAGTQLSRYGQTREYEKSAQQILDYQQILIDFTQKIYIDLKEPNENGSLTTPNPIYTQTKTGLQWFREEMNWIKENRCVTYGARGMLPDTIISKFVPCNYDPDAGVMHYVGTNFNFVSYDNVAYPLVKRIPISYYSEYITINVNNIDELLNILSKLVNMKTDSGFYIQEEHIVVMQFTRSGSGPASGSSWQEVPGTAIPLTELFGKDISKTTDYIEEARKSNNYLGIRLYGKELQLNKYLRPDGSILMQENSNFCWERGISNNAACISYFPAEDGAAEDMFVSSAGFAFGAENKKTIPEISYHTFVDQKPVYVPYLSCPTPISSNGLNMVNKMVAISSSFSSGSENGTDFQNPSNIISRGTKGAGGKHAFISGLSLEWAPAMAGDENKRWTITGAIGIDASFKKQNGNSSVLNNPKSISFVVLQWCEEE